MEFRIMAKYVAKSAKNSIFARIRPYSLMDRISDSGSDGCGSIPHGATRQRKGCSINIWKQPF